METSSPKPASGGSPPLNLSSTPKDPNHAVSLVDMLRETGPAGAQNNSTSESVKPTKPHTNMQDTPQEGPPWSGHSAAAFGSSTASDQSRKPGGADPDAEREARARRWREDDAEKKRQAQEAKQRVLDRLGTVPKPRQSAGDNTPYDPNADRWALSPNPGQTPPPADSVKPASEKSVEQVVREVRSGMAAVGFPRSPAPVAPAPASSVTPPKKEGLPVVPAAEPPKLEDTERTNVSKLQDLDPHKSPLEGPLAEGVREGATAQTQTIVKNPFMPDEPAPVNDEDALIYGPAGKPAGPAAPNRVPKPKPADQETRRVPVELQPASDPGINAIGMVVVGALVVAVLSIIVGYLYFGRTQPKVAAAASVAAANERPKPENAKPVHVPQPAPKIESAVPPALVRSFPVVIKPQETPKPVPTAVLASAPPSTEVPSKAPDQPPAPAGLTEQDVGEIARKVAQKEVELGVAPVSERLAKVEQSTEDLQKWRKGVDGSLVELRKRIKDLQAGFKAMTNNFMALANQLENRGPASTQPSPNPRP